MRKAFFRHALERAVPVAEAGIGCELGGAHGLLEMEKTKQTGHKLLIWCIDTGNAEIPDFLLIPVPGEEQMTVGGRAVEDETVGICGKTGCAKLREIVKGKTQAVGEIVVREGMKFRKLILKLKIKCGAWQ